mmetsp:Transcript_37510/g.81476  ORF Transcript_37510/g.81476 Transcript_37510/m.81476 type:complete len:397 (+) Transcript_37510:135-1325(+)|eukprot:CAMPEP_0206565414 /NCGR_PEP_ID=MMETSP0325_2-20121206/24057_1 /ASSEMBLY_ACC=CAM_ASM_000347 /TAXON_ID=2866 /ORGANISM="Crypthecodinium cohnii, Strain Seligo" /LENGTH=396 /DNA_ID=CAMNT_0054068265 /DNA_START=64 /DNA_END=1254 /DNA_ORIENTATION=+
MAAAVASVLLLGLLPLFFTFLIVAAAKHGEDPGEAERQLLDNYPLALCLDGSPAIYYIRQGQGSGRNRFHIYFEGGGFCTDDKDCLHRAGTYYGSSGGDDPSINFDHPFFAGAKKDSPLMWNWNHIMVRYCDGAYFSGHRDEAVKVKGSQIYYRGEHITSAVIDDLTKRYNFGNATDVIFSGCSAGGIRVFAHLNALAKMVAPTARVSGFPDSGFYLDRQIFTPLKHFVVDPNGQNATSLLDPHCVHDYPGQAEKCLLGSVAGYYLTVPIFAWQSQYDTDQRSCEMTQECADSRKCVQAYGDDLAQTLHTVLSNRTAGHGYFLDSCSRHCAGRNLPLEDKHKLTPLKALNEWYQGGESIYKQSRRYPCDRCCDHARGSWTRWLPEWPSDWPPPVYM